MAVERLEIREESKEDIEAVAPGHGKPFGLYDEGWRYSWHDTRQDALVEAHKLLGTAAAALTSLEDKVFDARDEVRTLNTAVLALDADPANK